MSDRPPPDPESPFSRFVALVRRELGAEDVRVLTKDPEPESPAANVLYARLLDGTRIAVTFNTAPGNPAALRRRLGMLMNTFAALIEAHSKPPARLSISRSLREELRALATRTQAVEALVLDAHSPVVWGATHQRGPLEEPPELSAVLHVVDPLEPYASVTPLYRDKSERPPPPEDLDADEDLAELVTFPPPAPLPGPRLADLPAPVPPEPSQTQISEPKGVESLPPPDLRDLVPSAQRALREVRSLPGIDSLRKGRPIRETVRLADFGYVAQSFATIYIIVLVFEAPFDELRAERALNDALPRIERLVLALPPLDPTPEPRANAVALRRPRRR
ncbi:hypothetical protein LVJ94_24550 [Pendulispora rubella]|uniref:Uncharacterized protein n=1 Tax=Pendulispora rubella TaxID=2741070 RepID=A0ABZ2LI12_9BACT